MRSLVAVVVLALPLACESGPPARTASGEVLDFVAWQERFARTSDAHDSRLTGDSLKKAIPLLDQHQVAALHGEFAASGKVDDASLVVIIQAHDKPERTIVMKNCGETHVCAFFAAAVKDGIVEKLPGVCRNAGRCSGE